MKYLWCYILLIFISGCSEKEQDSASVAEVYSCLLEVFQRLEPGQSLENIAIQENRPGLGVFEADTCSFEVRARVQSEQRQVSACEWNIKHEEKDMLIKLHEYLTEYYNGKTDTNKPVSEYEVWVYMINNKRFEVSLINNLPEDASLSLYIWPR